MGNEKEILASIQLFIELEGYRHDYLAKALKMKQDEFEKTLKGEGVDVFAFSKELAKLRGYNEFFFIDGRVDMFNKSTILGFVIRNQKDDKLDFQKYVPKENIEKINLEREVYFNMGEEMEKKKKELEELNRAYNLKRIDIENLL